MAASRLTQHLRNYASAGLLSALVGLCSFPLMTRSLSVADYGIVGLISSSITLFIAIGKLGMQHAVIRFYSQIKNANIAFSVYQLNSTVCAVFLVLATASTALFLLVGYQVLPRFLQYPDISSLFLLGSAVVFVRVLSSGVMNFLRAQQRSASVSIALSLARFLNLTFIISVVLITVLDPYAVLICLFFAELAGASYAAYQYRKDFYFDLSSVTGRLARVMLFYGMPLMVLESLGLVLRLSDRYLIEAMLGVDQLGQYSASYNLTAYLDIILLAALLQAVRPAYMQIWESEGAAPTHAFLSKGFHLYIVLGIPFVAMFAVTSPYLLGILAGPKYAVGTIIIPYVALSFWIEGAMYFLAAGLYIFKNTKWLMFCSLFATSVNLGLNLLLIPVYGIAGAAAVTLLSYIVFMIAATRLAFRHVRFSVQWRSSVIVSLASAVIFVVLSAQDFGNDIFNFLLKGSIGTTILLTLLWVLVPELRTWVNDLMIRIIGKSKSTGKTE